MQAVIGIDAGGTKVYGLVLVEGRVSGTCLLSTDGSSQEAFTATIAACFSELSEKAAESGIKIEALGIGIAGFIDYAQGVVSESVNLPLQNIPLRDNLKDMLALPVFLDNDANLAALAENRLGAGKGCQNQVHLTLGTGIGGGLIINGRLYRGTNGAGAELGHIIVLEGGPRTGCGHSGCLEALASGRAIEREARREYAEGWRPDIDELSGSDILMARHVAMAAERGDAIALKLWENMGRHLGVGIACYINIFNPEAVTFSGGMLNAWPFFQASMFRSIEEYAIPLSLKRARIAKSDLKGEAGALGAALLAMES